MTFAATGFWIACGGSEDGSSTLGDQAPNDTNASPPQGGPDNGAAPSNGGPSFSANASAQALEGGVPGPSPSSAPPAASSPAPAPTSPAPAPSTPPPAPKPAADAGGSVDSGFPSFDFDAAFPPFPPMLDAGLPPLPSLDAGILPMPLDAGLPPLPPLDAGLPSLDAGFPSLDGGFPSLDGSPFPLPGDASLGMFTCGGGQCNAAKEFCDMGASKCTALPSGCTSSPTCQCVQSATGAPYCSANNGGITLTPTK